MELDSERHYRFEVPPDTLWSAIADTSSYRRWWPWLTSFEAGGLVAGDEWRCAVRPPLPYTLRFSIHLDEVVPSTLVTAHLTGDISGPARLEVDEEDGGSALRLVSRLQPSNRAFGILATIARPLVRRGHDWVLDTGAGQFGARAVDGR